jgi:anti-anti-sigma factor
MASSGELRLEVEQQDAGPSGSVTVVRATGEVDLTNAEDLQRAIESDGALVLDLTGVGFMDSSGLRVLLVKAAEPEPRFALVLRHGSPVLRLIELSQVSDRLHWFENETEARDAVASADGADG